MVGWVFDRFRDHWDAAMAKRPPKDIEPRKEKSWEDYRTGLFHSLDRWDDARALFTILSSSVTADQLTDLKESRTLESIVNRSKTFRRLSPNDFDKMTGQVIHDIQENRVKALEKATRTFAVTQDRQVAAYLQALDILHADQHLVGSERMFATDLAAMLKIEDTFLITTLNDLMKAKNWSAGPMSSDKAKPEHTAFFTILAGAVLIDLEERPDETKELEALVMRTKTLSSLNEASRHDVYKEVVEPLKRSFERDSTRYDLIEVACRTLMSLPNAADICKSAYLHAIDLVHADRALKRSETAYLDQLKIEFNLDDTWSATARALIAQKNKY